MVHTKGMFWMELFYLFCYRIYQKERKLFSYSPVEKN